MRSTSLYAWGASSYGSAWSSQMTRPPKGVRTWSCARNRPLQAAARFASLPLAPGAVHQRPQICATIASRRDDVAERAPCASNDDWTAIRGRRPFAVQPDRCSIQVGRLNGVVRHVKEQFAASAQRVQHALGDQRSTGARPGHGMLVPHQVRGLTLAAVRQPTSSEVFDARAQHRFPNPREPLWTRMSSRSASRPIDASEVVDAAAAVRKKNWGR